MTRGGSPCEVVFSSPSDKVKTLAVTLEKGPRGDSFFFVTASS